MARSRCDSASIRLVFKQTFSAGAMSDDFRVEPRFSMNKLAEYMVANSVIRRRNLIRDQIRVSAFKAARYTEGRRAMVGYLANPSQSVRQLLGAASRLRDMVPTFPEKDDRRKYYMESARAVESFALIAEKIKNKKLVAVAGRKDADMMISGLRVVIGPDVCFLERGTERRLGALKLHCAKTYPLDVEGLRYAASLLYAYLQDEGDEPASGACVAVDVLTRKYEYAPRGIRNRVRALEVASQEIVGMWPILLAAMEAAAMEEEGEDLA